MLFLSKITILHIFDRFGDHTTKKQKFCHKLQPYISCIAKIEARFGLCVWKSMTFSNCIFQKIIQFCAILWKWSRLAKFPWRFYMERLRRCFTATKNGRVIQGHFVDLKGSHRVASSISKLFEVFPNEDLEVSQGQSASPWFSIDKKELMLRPSKETVVLSGAFEMVEGANSCILGVVNCRTRTF